MAAPLALAGLAVALAQAACDPANQTPHLLDLPRLDPGQWRVAQDLVAQILGFLAPVQQQRLRDDVANGFAQRSECRREPLGHGGICRGPSVDAVAPPGDAPRLHDAAPE